MQRYANILNDDAFKVVLLTPGNERLLSRMIELLLPGKHVQSLELRPTEQHGLVIPDKNSIFDLYCTSETGEMFIVEMQYSPQDSYADRMLCYASFPIRMQMAAKQAAFRKEGLRDKMDYSLLPIYVVSILNFSIGHSDERTVRDGLLSRYCICCPDTGEQMTDSLHFTFLELGRFTIPFGKPEACRTPLDKFAYELKYMSHLEACPACFEDDPFLKMLLEAAEIANLSVDQQMQLERIMRTEIDRVAEINYARKEGRAEGKAEARITAAKSLLAAGISLDTLIRALQLTEEEILKVKGMENR